MPLEKLIATGEHTNVYQRGDLAVKVFSKDYPKTEVLYEALTHARVEETGLCVPKIMEVGKEDGQWSISMERIQGKTLAQIMQEDPENLPKYIEQMVDIQIEIHTKKVPLLLKLKDRLASQIQSLDCIDDTRKYELLTRLDSCPKHIKLCHGNFNPTNIIVQGDKIYVVDWKNASQGNASADVGRTYLLLCLQNKQAADLYMDLFCQKTNTAKKYVQAWLPIVAAAQLTQNVDSERDLLMKWIDVVDYE